MKVDETAFELESEGSYIAGLVENDDKWLAAAMTFNWLKSTDSQENLEAILLAD